MTIALYVARRVGWALVVVFAVTSLSFVVARVLPGDPARMLVGPQASAKDVEHVRHAAALDQPLPAQYVHFWRRLVHRGDRDDADHATCAAAAGMHVDLGYSFHYRRPVVDLLTEKAPRSAELALAALFVQLLLGVGLGLAAAPRVGSRFDDAATGLALLGLSAPTFVIGLVLQYLFAHKLHLLPYDGYGKTPADHFASLVLPAATLGIFGAALYARITRDELGTILAEDYLRTARAKGASKLRALTVHGLRNALVPLATLAALDLGALAGGAVVTERLFRWPGMGAMAVEGLLNRDGAVISAAVLFSSFVIVSATLLLDLSYLLLDPRLRRPSR